MFRQSLQIFFKILFCLIVFLLSLFFFQKYLWRYFVKDQQLIYVTLKKNFFSAVEDKLLVEVVSSKEARAQGLSGRESLLSANGQEIDGLIFIYSWADNLLFWMKEMHFAIDICWFRQGESLGCSRNVSPPKANQGTESLPTYSSPGVADLVLETKPGRIKNSSLAKIFYNQLY